MGAEGQRDGLVIGVELEREGGGCFQEAESFRQHVTTHQT